MHLGRAGAPVLLREGWSWGAFLFQGLWLLWRGAWLPGVLWIATETLLAALLPPEVFAFVALAAPVLGGMFGRDLVRWQLARRGYTLVHVVAERSEDAAWARLLSLRPDLVARIA